VAITSALSWDAATGATSYDVYFSTSLAGVTSANPGSVEFQGNQSATSYDPPGDFTVGTTYYWRIDSVNAEGTTPGVVWSFTAALGGHRLVVAGDMGVLMWNSADSIGSDVAADVTLGSVTEGYGLALDGNRLFVASQGANPLHIFDNADSLADAATSDAALSQAAFGGSALPDLYDMFVDGADRLWICDGNSIRLFMDASALTSASTSRAQFTHAWSQLYTMGVDIAGDRLIGGQISGAGAVVYDSPASATGEGNTPDWTLAGGGLPRRMAVVGDRLYVASAVASAPWGYVNIWNNISSVDAAAAPDVTMGSASNLDLAVDLLIRDNTLVVCVTNGIVRKVNVYSGASSIGGEILPDREITDASMGIPKKAYLAGDDRLYVLAHDGVCVFENARTSPTFVVKIASGITSARDFVVIE
jgi:hypothetical protein